MNKIFSLIVILIAGCSTPSVPEPAMCTCVTEDSILGATDCTTLPFSYGEGIFAELKQHNCKVKRPYWKDGVIIIQALCPTEYDA